MAKIKRKIQSKVNKAAKAVEKEVKRPEYKSWWSRRSTLVKIIFIVLGVFIGLEVLLMLVKIAVAAIPIIIIGLIVWFIVWQMNKKKGKK